MKIHNPRTGEVIVNDHCTGGCYCHGLPIQFGDDPDVCCECGCPKTAKGFERVKAAKAKQDEEAKASRAP